MNDTPEYAVGWLTLAMINAGLAQGKNHSGLFWFLISLLFGPIATFVLVAFMAKRPDPTWSDEQDDAKPRYSDKPDSERLIG